MILFSVGLQSFFISFYLAHYFVLIWLICLFCHGRWKVWETINDGRSFLEQLRDYVSGFSHSLDSIQFRQRIQTSPHWVARFRRTCENWKTCFQRLHFQPHRTVLRVRQFARNRIVCFDERSYVEFYLALELEPRGRAVFFLQTGHSNGRDNFFDVSFRVLLDFYWVLMAFRWWCLILFGQLENGERVGFGEPRPAAAQPGAGQPAAEPQRAAQSRPRIAASKVSPNSTFQPWISFVGTEWKCFWYLLVFWSLFSAFLRVLFDRTKISLTAFVF